MRLGGPHQESRNILGILIERLRRAVGVLHPSVSKRRRHADRMSGEKLVVARPLRQGEILGRLLVALHQGHEVIDALLLVLREHVEHEPREAALIGARLGDHRKVRRQRAVIGKPCDLLVGERRREVVRRPTGPLDLASAIVDLLELVFGSNRRGLLGRVSEAFRIGEIAERQQAQAMAGRAHLAVDLEAALKLGLVKAAERTGERPFEPGRRLDFRGPGALPGQRRDGAASRCRKNEPGKPHELAPASGFRVVARRHRA